MTNYYLKPIRGKAFRVTKLDACGKPVTGATNGAVSKGFVKLDMKPQLETATDYKAKNANDELVINSRGRQILRWYDVTIDLIGFDPYVLNLLTGDPLVMNDATVPEAVGFSNSSGPVGVNFGLEIWTDLEGQPCDAAGNRQYGYFVVPFVLDGYLADTTVENGPLSVQISGARTSDGSQWGTGPYMVLNTAGTTPAPSKLLTPIGATEHRRLFMTTLAPPVVTVGPIAVP